MVVLVSRWGVLDLLPTHRVGQMRLTRRQREIIGLVARGFSDKQIAKQLGLSPRTIAAHLERLYLEHGLHKRAAAVAAWLEGRLGETT